MATDLRVVIVEMLSCDQESAAWSEQIQSGLHTYIHARALLQLRREKGRACPPFKPEGPTPSPDCHLVLYQND